jgi:hypothetical protein
MAAGGESADQGLQTRDINGLNVTGRRQVTERDGKPAAVLWKEVVKIAGVFVGTLAKRAVVKFGVPVNVRKGKYPHAYLTRTVPISAKRKRAIGVKNC